MWKKWSLHSRSIGSLVSAAVIGSMLPPWLHLATRILCIWDVYMACFLGLTWWAMVRATPATMRRFALQQDEGRIVILGTITTSACISLLAIGFMLGDKGTTGGILALHLSLAAFTIIGSWLLVHTIFALHYAHGYYRDLPARADCQARGLDFPDERDPDYWDFLYFSFVIGMTSQVSDVQISSRSMRRLALGHGVLSFFFNTTILAMSINIIAGLI